jgi:phosphatidylserine/phosphatidylglycerophosphate/cardiolipin synthase-like enzyme
MNTSMALFHRNSFNSKLYDQNSFYDSFIKDLKNCHKEVVIESPYITFSRMVYFYPIFKKLLANKIRLHIVTRDPSNHDDAFMKHQATNEILQCVELGIDVALLKGYHHRKLAIIDNNILWEGSLNILSFSNSREIMRRIEGEKYVREMQKFLKL